MSKASEHSRNAVSNGEAPAADGQALWNFPCAFPIKIMGEAHADLSRTVVEIVQRHAPDFAAGDIEQRASRSARFLSLTCTITAQSREQLDNLYRELSAHPLVKVVL